MVRLLLSATARTLANWDFSHRAQVRLTDDPKVCSSVEASIEFIQGHLERGETVYGEYGLRWSDVGEVNSRCY